MDHLNWGYLQLVLVTLVSGGLQVWWIGSRFRRRNLARPVSKGEVKRTLRNLQMAEFVNKQECSKQ